jgi:hypothetical protein
MRDVGDALVAELRVAQPGHRVVLVQPLLGLGRRLHVPLHQRPAKRPRNLLGEHRLSGAGLSLDQQRPRQRHRGVDRKHQIGRRDVGVGALEPHRHFPIGRNRLHRRRLLFRY